MGCCCGKACCCAKAVLTPDDRLIGTWVNTPDAVHLEVGVGAYRNKRGINLRMRSKNKNNLGEPQVLMRVIIEPKNLQYAEVDTGSGKYLLLDAPVIAWESDRLKMTCCGGEHTYSLQDNGGTLVFDGHNLEKATGTKSGIQRKNI
mmetsp:Transcript_3286/g.4389  ORF Transcript_3286/g.4389 Transcript_3286/m.4389 type:complete len:146 (-) Transcript_3286:335-772(-)